MKNKVFIFLAILGMLAPSFAYAYVGPGLGSGMLASVLGILLGFVMLIFGIVWYPIKRLYKWLTRKK